MRIHAILSEWMFSCVAALIVIKGLYWGEKVGGGWLRVRPKFPQKEKGEGKNLYNIRINDTPACFLPQKEFQYFTNEEINWKRSSIFHLQSKSFKTLFFRKTNSNSQNRELWSTMYESIMAKYTLTKWKLWGPLLQIFRELHGGHNSFTRKCKQTFRPFNRLYFREMDYDNTYCSYISVSSTHFSILKLRSWFRLTATKHSISPFEYKTIHPSPCQIVTKFSWGLITKIFLRSHTELVKRSDKFSFSFNIY